MMDIATVKTTSYMLKDLAKETVGRQVVSYVIMSMSNPIALLPILCLPRFL